MKYSTKRLDLTWRRAAKSHAESRESCLPTGGAVEAGVAEAGLHLAVSALPARGAAARVGLLAGQALALAVVVAQLTLAVVDCKQHKHHMYTCEGKSI